jgi:heptosyltransferase II
VRHVVIRLPNWMGDTVMALPALRAIRQAFPERMITLVGPWASLLTHQGVGARLMDAPRTFRHQVDMARQLRADRSTLAILFPNSFRSALIACLWGSRWRA